MGTLDEVKGLIGNPPKEYRSAPFWGWNDKLQKENLGEHYFVPLSNISNHSNLSLLFSNISFFIISRLS